MGPSSKPCLTQHTIKLLKPVAPCHKVRLHQWVHAYFHHHQHLNTVVPSTSQVRGQAVHHLWHAVSIKWYDGMQVSLHRRGMACLEWL